MKIEIIRGGNLASLAGAFELDFRSPPLADASLFAISGETGAGKSTILDALCLALYGRFPRLGSDSQQDRIEIRAGESIQTGDPRSILKTGGVDAFAEVELRLGDELFLARWSVHRANARPDGKLQAAKRTLLRLPEEEIVASGKSEVEREIRARLGLTYEQFRRTVLLAQNDFDAFLRASDSDRADLLEKITGTQIYSRLSEGAFAHEKQAREEIEQLERRLEIPVNIDLVPEERAQLEADIKQAEEQRPVLQEQAARQQRIVAFFRQLEQHRARLEQAGRRRRKAGEALAKEDGLRHRLERLELALPLAGVTQKAQAAHDELSRLQAEAEEAGALQTQLEKRSLVAQKKLRASADEEQRRAKALAEAEPALREALKLDHQLAELAEQLLQASDDNKRRQQEQADHERRLSKRRKQLEELQRKQAGLERLLAENKGVAHLTIRRVELVQEFDELQELAQGLARDEALLAARRQRREKLEAQAADDEKRRETLQVRLDEAAKQAGDMAQKLAALDPAQSRRRRDQLVAWRGDLAELQRRLGEQDRAARRQLELSAELERLAQAIERRGVELQGGEAEIKAVEARSLEAQSQFSRTQTLMSDSVLRLRADLLDGEPCPVCGSLEHPGHHDEVGARLLADLKARRRELDEQLRRLRDSREKAAADRAADQARQQKARRERQQAQAETEELRRRTQQARQQAQKAAASMDMPSPRSQSRFLSQSQTQFQTQFQSGEAGEQLEQLARLDEEARQQVERLQEKLAAIQQLEADRDRALKQTAELEAQLQRRNREAAASAAKLQEAQTQASEAEAQTRRQRDRRDMLADRLLSALAGFDLARAELLNDPRSAAKRVSTLLRRLEQAQDEQAQLLAQQVEAQRDMAALEERKALLDEQREQGAGRLRELEQKQAKLNRARALLLDGRPVEQERRNLQTALETAREAHSQAGVSLRETDARKAELARQLTLLEQKRQSARERLARAAARRDEAIRAKGLELDEALALLAIPADERQRMREKIAALAAALAEASALLEDQRRQLADLEANSPLDPDSAAAEQTLQQGEQKQKQTEQQLADLLEKLGRNRNRLEQDDKARVRREKLEKKIEHMRRRHETWLAVSEAIGSSDGARFRRFAQGVTLDHLIALANEQLANINPRYAIERNPLSSSHGVSGLGLQIIDIDMGGEARSVQSLSGGERFLASLALALGLSRLDGRASFVDTLFIDEGFGALDARSLDMAMEALERLQSEGRKVGVISHVEALKERVSVLVLVEKQGEGRSRVRIASAFGEETIAGTA